MEGLGFTAEDFAEDEVEVWPENWPSVQFFIRISTQWRHGFSGPTGLDYAATLATLRELHDDQDERRRIFDDVQVMERVALVTLAERREQASH